MTQTRTYDTFVLFEPHNKPLMSFLIDIEENQKVWCDDFIIYVTIVIFYATILVLFTACAKNTAIVT